MSKIARIGKIIDDVNTWLGNVAYILISVQTGFIVIAIFLRYVVNRPIKASAEIEQIIMVFVALLGASFVLRIGGHIHVELFIDRLRSRTRDVVMGINYLLFGIPYCVLVFYLCLSFVESSYSIHERTQGAFILIWPIKAMLLVGFTLLAFQFLVSGIRYIHQGTINKQLSDLGDSHV